MSEQQRRLYRSSTDRFLAGVCGGMGEYFNIDPAVIRVLWVFLTLFGGSGILLYIVAWIVVPKHPGQESGGAPSGGTAAVFVIGIAMVGFGILLLLDNLDMISMHHWWHRSWDFALPAFLILLGIYLLAKKPRSELKENQPPTAANSSEQRPQKKLHRSLKDKKIFGVCGGIGQYLDLDPTFVRLAYIAFTFLSFGAGILLYFLLFLVMPEESLPEVKRS